MNFLFACMQAFLAVALGAFGAHGLAKFAPEANLATWDTAVDYHFAHALALLILVLLEKQGLRVIFPRRLFTLGIALFSGSLYLLCLTGITKLGAITPLGGLCFLAAWILLGVQGKKVFP